MNIAIPICEGITALDAIGPYEVLSRLPGARVRFVAIEAGPYKTDNRQLTMIADEPLSAVPHPEIVMVVGGVRDAGIAHPKSAPRLDPRGAYHEPVDDLGVHGLARARGSGRA